MDVSFKQLGPGFFAEVSPIDLRLVHDRDTLLKLREGMDTYGVLVFRDQPFTNADQLAFAQRFDGQLHAKTSVSVLAKNRHGNEALTDISNVGADGNVFEKTNRLRMSTVSNRLWHSDASFEDPCGRYSMLSARVLPPVRADTQFTDMRAAWDALDDAMKALIADLHVHHSIAYSRSVLGFEFSDDEKERLKGVVQPLVRTMPRTGRKALYVGSHASKVIEMPLPDGRLLLHDLMEHATQREFVYSHEWHDHDLVIWDNRCTLHRARPFDDTKYRRELVRTTTLDLPFEIA